MPSKFIPERYSSESEYYNTPSGEKRHSLAWCPFITGKRHCLGKEFVFMIAKTVMSMFLTAMPDLDFSESDLHKLDEMFYLHLTATSQLKCRRKYPSSFDSPNDFEFEFVMFRESAL